MEAYFKLHTPQSVIDDRVANWERATLVEQSSGLTVLIATENHRWISDVIRPDSEAVTRVALQRSPGETFDLAEALLDG